MNEALRQAAENAADVLDEARTYVGCESWSPSMLEECERALRMLRAALAQPPAPTAQQCTCPSGDGSLRWPCPQHPANIAQPVQQPGAEPDMRHPKIQALIGSKARCQIELMLVEQLIEDPDCDLTSMDMEYWGPMHDRLKEALTKAAPAQRQPLSDEQIDSLTFQFLTAELGPTAYDRAIARAIEAAHNITAAPAAQKGEKL